MMGEDLVENRKDRVKRRPAEAVKSPDGDRSRYQFTALPSRGEPQEKHHRELRPPGFVIEIPCPPRRRGPQDRGKGGR